MMTRSTRLAMAAVAAALLLFALPSAALAKSRGASRQPMPRLHGLSAPGALAADDELPGVPLPASPVNGYVHFDDPVDWLDIYKVHLNAGQRLDVSLNGPDGSDIGIALYSSDTTDIYEDPVLMEPWEPGYPQRVVYTAPTGGGDYYLVVFAYDGGGNYTMNYTIGGGHGKANIAGVPITPSPLTGELDAVVEYDHVYKVRLTAGQKFDVSLNGDEGTAFDLYVYGPDAKDVNVDDPLEAAQHEDVPVYPLALSFTAPTTGDYYLDICARPDSATGGYTATYSPSLVSATATFSNPIAYDLKSGLKTWLKVKSPQAGLTAKLVLKTASGDKQIYSGTLANQANVEYWMPGWDGKIAGQRLPSASYDWVLTLSKPGYLTQTVTGKLLISKIVFALSGTSTGNVAIRKDAYTVPGNVNCYVSATTGSGGTDTLNVSLSGPSGYFAKPKTAGGVAPPWTFGPAPLSTTGYINGTSAPKFRGSGTWAVTGKTNVSYKITVIQ